MKHLLAQMAFQTYVHSNNDNNLLIADKYDWK